jgi:hypothetical protein
MALLRKNQQIFYQLHNPHFITTLKAVDSHCIINGWLTKPQPLVNQGEESTGQNSI